MRPVPPPPIRILLAALDPRARALVEGSLAQAVLGAEWEPDQPGFRWRWTAARGIPLLEAAAGADVVVLGLEEEQLPGEASHLLATYPALKIIGLDQEARPRMILGAVAGALVRDLPTVIRWITQRLRREAARPTPARHGPR